MAAGADALGAAGKLVFCLLTKAARGAGTSMRWGSGAAAVGAAEGAVLVAVLAPPFLSCRCCCSCHCLQSWRYTLRC